MQKKNVLFMYGSQDIVSQTNRLMAWDHQPAFQMNNNIEMDNENQQRGSMYTLTNRHKDGEDPFLLMD